MHRAKGAIVFPASGPAFCIDGGIAAIRTPTWAIGISTGALRAMCMYFGRPER